MSTSRARRLPVAAAVLAAGMVLVASCVRTPRAEPGDDPTVSQASTGIASAVASLPTATPTPTPTATADTVDGLHIYTVSELLDARAAGSMQGGPIALRGFWSERTFMHTCVPPAKPPGDLELRCNDGEWGITEADEPIGVLTVDHRFVPASSPHLTPYLSDEVAIRLAQSEIINGQRPRPVPIIVVGHLDDPRAKDCQPKTKRLCADRYVIDRIVDYHPEAVPTPGITPAPTPFPFGSPPPPPFDVADCAGDGPYSFVGWITGAELKLDQGVPTTAYAAITKDVIEMGSWIDDPEGSGHRFRTMGRLICFAAEWDEGVITFAWVPGSAYREWDDGRRTQLSP